MDDFWKWYLAIVAAVTLLQAQFSALWEPPIESGYPAPVNNDGYPAPAATVTPPVVRWVDGCGNFHTDPPPSVWPTAVPPGGCDY